MTQRPFPLISLETNQPVLLTASTLNNHRRHPLCFINRLCRCLHRLVFLFFCSFFYPFTLYAHRRLIRRQKATPASVSSSIGNRRVTESTQWHAILEIWPSIFQDSATHAPKHPWDSVCRHRPHLGPLPSPPFSPVFADLTRHVVGTEQETDSPLHQRKISLRSHCKSQLSNAFCACSGPSLSFGAFLIHSAPTQSLSFNPSSSFCHGSNPYTLSRSSMPSSS